MNNRRLNKIRRKIFAKPQYRLVMIWISTREMTCLIRVPDRDVAMTPMERLKKTGEQIHPSDVTTMTSSD